jgi:hypothetical protein
LSELLNSLNVPSEAPAKSWAAEVSEVAPSEPAERPVEAASTEPAPIEPETQEPAVEAPETQETATEEVDRRVPLKALQEERQKRAELERKAQEYEQRLYEMQQWAEQVQQQMGQPQPEPVVEPDPETDPIGALKAARDQLRQMQEATQQQQYVERLNQVAYQAAVEAQQRVPDYQDAYKYAINSRAQELLALGTPQQAISQILQQEELRLIDTAVRNGRNPAEAIYSFAKARGFQGKTVAPAPAPAPAAAPDPVLAQAKAEVAASASAGGAPPSRGQMSISDIAQLNGAAFDSAWKKLEAQAGRKSSVFRD